MIATTPTRTRRWIVRNVRRLVGTDQVVHLLDRQAELISRRLDAGPIAGPSPAPEARTESNGRSDRLTTLEGLLGHRDPESRLATIAAYNAVSQAGADAFFRTIYNGVEVQIPRDTLLTMVQCLYGTLEGPLVVEVEECHRKWMMAHLVDGGTFLDVGAATGAMTIPIAATFGSKVRIIAFEPARKARGLLESTLTRNGLEGIEIVPQAVSNVVGRTTFCEFDHDETGACPFLPETSAIESRITVDDDRSRKVEVGVTTLDTFFSGRGAPVGPVVIKIDVEGFEVLVLEGASDLIATSRPWFSIDIHRDPFGEGTTEAKVRRLLGSADYTFKNMGHVLVASP